MAEPIRHHRRTKTTSVIKSFVMAKPGFMDRPTSYEAEDTIKMTVPSPLPSSTPHTPGLASRGAMMSFLPPDHPHSRQSAASSGVNSPSALHFQAPGPSAAGQARKPVRRQSPTTIDKHEAATPRDSSKPSKPAAILGFNLGLGRNNAKAEQRQCPRDKENAAPSSPSSQDSPRHSHDEDPIPSRSSRSSETKACHSRALSALTGQTPRRGDIPQRTSAERPSWEYFSADMPRLTKVEKHSRARLDAPIKADSRARSPNATNHAGPTSRLSRFAPFSRTKDTAAATAEKPATKNGFFRSKGQSKVAEVVAAFNDRARAAADSIVSSGVVAAGAGTAPPATSSSATTQPDSARLEADFEAVLESRNIGPQQRAHMRTLRPELKAQFIKSHQETPAAAAAGTTPPTSVGASATRSRGSKIFSTRSSAETHRDAAAAESAGGSDPARGRASDRTRGHADRGRTLSLGRKKKDNKDRDEPKKRRPRSRAFTFGRADKKKSSGGGGGGDDDTARPIIPPSPSATSVCSVGDRRGLNAAPFVFVDYLAKAPSPAEIEVGRVHKLRLLIRNETVEWVDEFIDLDGMAEIVKLLHRIMEVEWREEHEDQLLHETLLCLRGLCTTSRGLADLPDVAPTLFPALLAMIFDRERKGPSEFTTRAIVTNILFIYLSEPGPEDRAGRAAEILGYLRDPDPPEESRPLPWIQGMRRPRPYQLWCKEATSVAKEVFWIFLHSLNVVPLPSTSEPSSPLLSCRDGDTAGTAESAPSPPPKPAPFAAVHYPKPRPPVPAAPHVGGVEWDATNYIASHLDLLNGLIASTPTPTDRNALRHSLAASGFEKLMGGTLRKCKEKFYSSVHDGLRTWVAAAVADEWDSRLVRMGPPIGPTSSSARTDGSAEPTMLPRVDTGAPLAELKFL